jgi:hypothetical protein
MMLYEAEEMFLFSTGSLTSEVGGVLPDRAIADSVELLKPIKSVALIVML